MISLPINPFLANQPVMGPQPPEDFVAASPAKMLLPNSAGEPPTMMLLPNSAGSPGSMMLLPNTPVMGPQPPVASAPPTQTVNWTPENSWMWTGGWRDMVYHPREEWFVQDIKDYGGTYNTANDWLLANSGGTPYPAGDPWRKLWTDANAILEADTNWNAPVETVLGKALASRGISTAPMISHPGYGTGVEEQQRYLADNPQYQQINESWIDWARRTGNDVQHRNVIQPFGEGSYRNLKTGGGFLSAKDIDYNTQGSVANFYGWTGDEARNKLESIFSGSTKNDTTLSGYLKDFGLQSGSVAGLSDEHAIAYLDAAIRQDAAQAQNKSSFFDKVVGGIADFALGALPAIAGGIVAGPVGAAVAGGVSKGVKGGLTDGLLGAATGYLGGVGLNKLAPDLSNLAGLGTSGLGGSIGLLNTLQSVGLPVTDATSLGLGGLENVSSVPGDALFDTSVANQIATGSGVGAGALGPTDVLANAITPNLANYAAAAAPALNPFTGLSNLASGGGFVNPGALGGTTLDQIANTLDTTLPLSDIAPSLMGPQPPPGFYDTLEKAKTLADLGGTVTDLFNEEPEQGGIPSAPSFSFPGSGSQGTPYRSIQFPTGWGRVPTFNLFGNPFQRG